IGGMGNFGGLRGRTFTVTGPDGDTKEISTDDARSIVVNRSFSSVTENGERKIKQGGTAIIVAADGQRYEVDLSTLDDDQLEGQPIEAKPVEVKKSYMIGVFCEPVPAMMRSQLNLDEDVGLVVKRVQDGSPAAVAGVKQFDILLYADDKLLSDVNELTGVVTEAGAEDQAFTLTVMRGGEEIPVEVTPSEREFAAGLPRRMPMGEIEMNDMGPGLIFDKGLDGDMMQRMQNHMKQVREEMMRMDNLLQNQALPMPGIPKAIFPEQGLPANDIR
ncbi:PDZ domain-containing protein, partial [bacterium]|nr:PDZ domain-containing protein [bacterium]